MLEIIVLDDAIDALSVRIFIHVFCHAITQSVCLGQGLELIAVVLTAPIGVNDEIFFYIVIVDY